MQMFSFTFLLLSLFLVPFQSSPVAAAEKENSSDKLILKCTCSEELDLQIREFYRQANLQDKGLKYQLFRDAFIGYCNLRSADKSLRPVLSVIDFGLPGTQKRMWVIDLKKKKVLEHTLVAHGKNSGENYAVNFSNSVNSHMSSLGFYVTGKTYNGKHGLSLRLNGVDEGFNTNAAPRAIVLHGAGYVSENFIRCTGRLGRSFGCPAVPVEKTATIIDLVKNGSVLFISNKNKKFSSCFLKEEVALEVLALTGNGGK